MPYIKQEDRSRFEHAIKGIALNPPKTAGELNYILTRIAHIFLGTEANYQAYNDAIGALEGAKLELYRRQVAKYEDKKIKENGDV
jgi:hypothetical protein